MTVRVPRLEGILPMEDDVRVVLWSLREVCWSLRDYFMLVVSVVSVDRRQAAPRNYCVCGFFVNRICVEKMYL